MNEKKEIRSEINRVTNNHINFNHIILFCPDITGRGYKEWYRGDFTPMLLIEVSKELLTLNYLLGDLDV